MPNPTIKPNLSIGLALVLISGSFFSAPITGEAKQPKISETVRVTLPDNYDLNGTRVDLSSNGQHFACSYSRHKALSDAEKAAIEKVLETGRGSANIEKVLELEHRAGMAIVDGQYQFPMDGIGFGTFSLDGSLYVYSAINKDKRRVKRGNQEDEEDVPGAVVVADGKPACEPYFDFEGHPQISADGTVWAAVGHRYLEAVARRNHQIVNWVPNDYVVLVNGTALGSIGQNWEFYQPSPVVFSPAGHDYLVCVNTNPPQVGTAVWHDGQCIGSYRGAGMPVFSRDGRHWGFLTYQGSGWLDSPNSLIVDGREKPLPPHQYVDKGQLLMGADEGHCLYFTRSDQGSQMWFWWKGQRSHGYKYLDKPVLSPDGRRMACLGQTPKGERLIVDGAEVENVRPHGPPVFSPDSRQVACIVAEKQKKYAVAVDGKAGEQYEEIQGLTWSPDSRQVAYAAKKNGEWRLVAGEGEQPLSPPATDIQRVIFSPDSHHAAVIFSGQERTYLAAKGWVSTGYDAVLDAAFSPDGRHFAAVVKEHRDESESLHPVFQLILDGTVQSDWDAVWNHWITSRGAVQELWWNDSDQLHYWAAKGSSVVEVLESVE